MQSENNKSLDEILDDLKSEYENSQTLENTNKNSSIENLLDAVKSDSENLKKSVEIKRDRKKANNSQVNQELNSLKARYQNKQNKQKTRQKLIYDRNKQDIISQEQQKQLQRKQLIRQAEKWLANLDPYSDEGMWFNQLAESYPSKLDAAISYLSTTDRSST